MATEMEIDQFVTWLQKQPDADVPIDRDWALQLAEQARSPQRAAQTISRSIELLWSIDRGSAVSEAAERLRETLPEEARKEPADSGPLLLVVGGTDVAVRSPEDTAEK